MAVTIAMEAEGDLESIALFIGSDSPSRALSFVDELVANCYSLGEHPLRHPIVAGYGQRLRRFPYKGYSIYYQIVDANDVVVVHILSDALDHSRVLNS